MDQDAPYINSIPNNPEWETDVPITKKPTVSIEDFIDGLSTISDVADLVGGISALAGIMKDMATSFLASTITVSKGNCLYNGIPKGPCNSPTISGAI